MVGVDCAKATTTMKVVEYQESERESIRQRISKHYQDAWHMDQTKADKMAFNEVESIEEMLKSFPASIILERRGNIFRERKI